MHADHDQFLQLISRPGAGQVLVKGRLLRPGDRVRLKPGPGGDIMDLHMAGRLARIEGVDEDDEGRLHVAVMLDDDSGQDLASARHPAHRFFFSPEELEPVEEETKQRKVLVAGIGNIFFGDDGFGVEVARLLSSRRLSAGIEVADFGIRGMDLAYALGRPYDAAILVDALPWGAAPGTIHIIEPDIDGGNAIADAHRMDPVTVLGLARSLAPLPPVVLIVGCEPEPLTDPEVLCMGLSDSVASSVEQAAEAAIALAERCLTQGKTSYE